MKRYIVVPVLMALAIFLTAVSASSEADATRVKLPHIEHKPVPTSCTVQDFRPWSAKIWAPSKWERGKPNKLILVAYSKRLGCAPPAHAKAIKATWHRHQHIYFEKRKEMLWFAKYRSFEYPDGSRWAVPYPIAWCESGGNYYVGPSGAYGLIPPFPQYLSPKIQDEIAYNLYLEQGEGPWAPYEGGCAYR